jgi:hypothetical protein
MHRALWRSRPRPREEEPSHPGTPRVGDERRSLDIDVRTRANPTKEREPWSRRHTLAPGRSLAYALRALWPRRRPCREPVPGANRAPVAQWIEHLTSEYAGPCAMAPNVETRAKRAELRALFTSMPGRPVLYPARSAPLLREHLTAAAGLRISSGQPGSVFRGALAPLTALATSKVGAGTGVAGRSILRSSFSNRQRLRACASLYEPVCAVW